MPACMNMSSDALNTANLPNESSAASTFGISPNSSVVNVIDGHASSGQLTVVQTRTTFLFQRSAPPRYLSRSTFEQGGRRMAAKKAPAKKASAKKASAKKESKTKAPSKGSTKRSAKGKTKAAGTVLSTADIARLMGLSSEHDRRPTHAVRDGEQEAKELLVTFDKLGTKLVTHGGIDKNAGKDLSTRLRLLSTAERLWTSERDFAAKADIKTARKQGTEAKRLAVAALRHFKRGDQDIQVRLDRIAEGSGDLDLSDDLNKLADLIDANLKELKTPEIKSSTAAAMCTLASAISDAITERNTDVESGNAMKLRNRAYWHLYELIVAIQSAGRFVYRDDLAARKHFRTLRRQK